jgi:hypothetical protein
MHLIASSRLGAAPLTTTMEHCRCRNHHDAPSSWLRRPGTLILVPVIGVVADFTGLWLYERRLRSRPAGEQRG